MNSDTDALAAYFEAWREGWPVPSCVQSLLRLQGPAFVAGFYKQHPQEPCEDVAEALTGVLVVELARRGLELSHYVCPEYGPSGADWRVADDSTVGGFEIEGRTPLCALVAAWLEVSK